jgi:hypothetical protein
MIETAGSRQTPRIVQIHQHGLNVTDFQRAALFSKRKQQMLVETPIQKHAPATGGHHLQGSTTTALYQWHVQCYLGIACSIGKHKRINGLTDVRLLAAGVGQRRTIALGIGKPGNPGFDSVTLEALYVSLSHTAWSVLLLRDFPCLQGSTNSYPEPYGK